MRKLEREVLRRRVGNKRLRTVYHARHKPFKKRKSMLRRGLSKIMKKINKFFRRLAQ